MPKAVIFDLDGTLTDTSIDIFESLNKTLSNFGYNPITVEETKRFVGDGARKLVERAIKAKPLPNNFDEILAFYNKTYNFCGSPKTCVYDGMAEVLTRLKAKGCKIAVVSNKPQQGVDEVCKKFFSEIKLDIFKEYVKFGVADILTDYKNIEPDNSVIFARNFWPYLGCNEQYKLAENLHSHLGKNSLIMIGEFDTRYEVDNNFTNMANTLIYCGFKVFLLQIYISYNMVL